MQPPAESSRTRAPATIGWFTAGCVLVSNMIGGGIFTTTGILARDLGDPLTILALWLLGALFAVGGAMVYGELGARLPHAGGDYVYLREAYGPLAAFLSGWTSFTIGFGAATAASAISFSSYALQVLRVQDAGGWLANSLSLALVWTATLVHCRGVHAGGRFQLFLTTAKVVAIVALIFGGFAVIAQTDRWAIAGNPTRPPTLGTAAISFVIVTYCYLGWNVTGYIAGDIADPKRTLPVVMIGGTLFVALIYVLLNLVYLSALSVGELAREPIVPVAEKTAAALWGPWGGQIVSAVLCLSIAGAVSAMTWAGPRVYWAMGRDRVAGSWLAVLHPATRVPVRAIVLQSVWASLLIVTGTFEQLIVSSGLVLSLFMAVTLSTVFYLRQTDTASIGYRTPGYPLLPSILILSALAMVVAAVVQRPRESLFGGFTVMSGIPVYYFLRRNRREEPG
jgi:APA family basic amino acid/polyamine antiporter